MKKNTSYQQAREYLDSFVDYSLKDPREMAAAEFDLWRVFELMESLGNPQQAYPSIHVAGSKGKGSVCVLCAAALEAQGYRVGLYTSPHLHEFEERIQINREKISRDELIRLVDEIKPHAGAISGLTTFEIETALGFWHFERQKVDAAVIEVGLGGRLDATNVVLPRISVITALFLEHTLVLGDSLRQIAAEKGGIIKPGVPVVVSPQKAEAIRTLAQIAAENASPLIRVDREYDLEPLAASLEGQSFLIRPGKTGEPVELTIRLLGPHQVENAATAYAALQTFRDQGLPVSEEAIREGFASARWPARFEILQRQPPVIADAAHTPEAARQVRRTLEGLFPDRPVILVFGVSEDKNVPGMLAELMPVTRQVICTQSTHPRALDAGALLDLVLPGGVPVRAVEDVPDAVETAIRAAGEDDVILVTGSLFVAADARAAR